MALLSHTLTISYQGDGSTVSVPVKTLTGDAQLAYDNIIADGVTNGEIDLVFGFATVKMMILTSDQAMTVKTNSTSAPDDTIALGANIPVIFYTGGPVSWTNPFSVNVTKFYVTNASGKPSRLRFRALIDASPVLPDTAA